MPARDDLPDYLDGALEESQSAELDRAMEEDSALCETVLRQRRIDRALHVLLSSERHERVRDSIHAAVRGVPMTELRAQVLSHTSGLRRSWIEGPTSWWQNLAPRPRLAFALATLLVLVASALMLWQPATPSTLRLAGSLDGAELRRAGHRVNLPTGAEVLPGDEIHAGSTALTLRFDREATTFTLDPETTVIVRSLAPQKKFELLQGALVAEVARQRAGAMLWTTDNAEARVLGTKFALTADGVFTRLDVEKGAVELQRRGSAEQTVVRAGQFAAADSRSLVGAQPAQTEPVWNVPQRETPGIAHTSFTSKTAGMEMGMNVLLPPGYNDLPGRRYPVLYFLHDTGGDEHTEAARFGPLLRDAVAKHRLPPCIAVFPNVGPGYTPQPWVMSEVLARDLPQFIDAQYRTIPFRGARTVCGIGQGGHRALMLGAMHSPVFGSCGVCDDPLRGGPPGFRMLLERTQGRWANLPRNVLLLHSATYPPADAAALGGFLESLGTHVETHAISAPAPRGSDYPGALWAELGPWLDAQWKPARPR